MAKRSSGNGKRQRTALTEFGATVLSLMSEKGVRSEAELVELLEDEGMKVSHPGLSGWLYGHYAVRKDFPQKLAVVLALSEPEKVRLAMAFTYGQDRAIARPRSAR